MSIISNSAISSKYEFKGTIKQVPIEYVFIDGEGQLRSKTKTLDYMPKTIQDVPPLDMDETKDADIVLLGAQHRRQLVPIAMYQDPFRVNLQGKLVLCEHPTRQHCKEIMEHYAHLEPWFGMEQEYVLFDPKTNRPLGWPLHGEPESQVSSITW